MRYIIVLAFLLVSCTHEIKNNTVQNIQQYSLHWPLTISDKDHIRTNVQSQWTIINIKDFDGTIDLEVHLKEDGTILNVINQNQNRYKSDINYRVLSDSATRAIYKANPFENRGLPIDMHKKWQMLELHFNPKDMLY